MKTKLIFIMTTVMILQAKTVFAVDNAVEAVDKEYQHELICQASTGTENFELNLKWSVEHMHIPDGRAPLIKRQFTYELTNLTANTKLQGTYGNFFSEHANIKVNDEGIHAVGSFFMYKRLGYIQKKTHIMVNHDGAGHYYLNAFSHKAVDSIENPKDYCNPPTRLCGSEPPFPKDAVVVSHLFTDSSCQFVK